MILQITQIQIQNIIRVNLLVNNLSERRSELKSVENKTATHCFADTVSSIIVSIMHYLTGMSCCVKMKKVL